MTVCQDDIDQIKADLAETKAIVAELRADVSALKAVPRRNQISMKLLNRLSVQQQRIIQFLWPQAGQYVDWASIPHQCFRDKEDALRQTAAGIRIALGRLQKKLKAAPEFKLSLWISPKISLFASLNKFDDRLFRGLDYHIRV